MPRNRDIYQINALYVGPSGDAGQATGAHYQGSYDYDNLVSPVSGENFVKELYRVQSANYSIAKTLQDVNQFNVLAAIDRIPIEQPTVSLDFTYLQYNLYNEKLVGFTILNEGEDEASWVSAVSGILNDTTDEKNYFVVQVPEGNDVAGLNWAEDQVADIKVMGIGNGFISNYSTDGSVGNLPTVSVTVEALNAKMDTGVFNNYIPAVFPDSGAAITNLQYMIPSGRTSPNDETVNASSLSLSTLRPGDITFDLGLDDTAGAAFVVESDLKVQSYSMSFDLTRENLQKLGSKYAFAKVISFPATATLNVTADIGDLATGSLVEQVENNTTFNPLVTLKHPTTKADQIKFQLKNAKLDNQDFTSSIGPNKSVSLTFTTQIGGPQDNTAGVFMSGVNTA